MLADNEDSERARDGTFFPSPFRTLKVTKKQTP